MLDVRRGERGRTLLAFGVLLLIVAAFTVVKAVRDAVFLSRFGVREIGLVSIGLALLAGLVASGYHRVTAGQTRVRVIAVSHVIVAASLLALGAVLRAGSSSIAAAVLYAWSALFGIFLVTQFWLLAGDLFDVREAKRLYGFIGAGAILGGLGGGVLARALADALGAAGLLSFAAGLLLAAAGLTRLAAGLGPSEVPRVDARAAPAAAPTLVELLTKPTFVRLIALGLLVSTVVTTLLDWQLKAVAKDHYAGDPEAMAGFFGLLLAGQSGLSLFLQLLATDWLLRRHGIGVGRMVLPVVLSFGMAAVLGHGLLPVTLLTLLATVRVADGGLRFAIDKATVELTWLPVAPEERARGKAFVDTVVDRLGTGVTGVVWLGFSAFGIDRPERVHWVSACVLAAAIGWLVLLRRTHRAYVDEVRTSLATRTVDLESLRMSLGEAEAQRTLLAALGSNDADQIRFGLYLLRSSGDTETELPDLSALFAHGEPAVLVEAFDLAAERGDRRYRAAAEKLLAASASSVVEAAVIYLRATAAEGELAPAHADTDDADPSSVSYALVDLSNPQQRDAVSLRLQELLARQRDPAQVRLIGAAPPDAAAELLRPLLDDDDPAIVTAALQAAGRARAVALSDKLGDMLARRRWRPKVVGALADMGAPGVAALLPRLRDARVSIDARRALAWLAGGSREPRLAAPLFELLGRDPPELAHAAVHALARLSAFTRVPVDRAHVEQRLAAEAEQLYRDLLLLNHGSWLRARDRYDGEPLDRALHESCDDGIHRVFWLLSLLHHAEDVRSAYRGLRSPSRSARAKSVELLDNLLAGEPKRLLVPLFDELDPDELASHARRACGVVPETPAQGLSRLLRGSRRWLRAVACWTIGQRRLRALRGELTSLPDGDDELVPVRQRALRWIDGETKEPTMALTVVEKALKLRGVDVLRAASSEDLAYVAQIAGEVERAPGECIYREGDAPDALYVVIAGQVELRQGEVEIGVIGPGEAFGSWALVDEAPRVASALARNTATLLKVPREDFLDLLSDRAGIVQAVFKAMVERIRSLAELAKG